MKDDDGNIDPPLRCCLAVCRHYGETGLPNQPTHIGRLWFAAEGLAKPLGVACDACDPCHADVLLEIANR